MIHEYKYLNKKLLEIPRQRKLLNLVKYMYILLPWQRY